MHREPKHKRIIMVGPSPNGLGGISRVVRIWKKNGIFDIHGIKYVPSVSDGGETRYYFLLSNLLFFLVQIMGGCDLLYIHTSSYKSFFRKSVFIVCALVVKKPVILHIHPSHFFDFITGVVGLKRWYVGFLLGKIDSFVVLTEDMKEKMLSLFPTTKVCVLRNPVDLANMDNRGSYRRRSNHILFLGWFIPEKGVYELVDAIAILLEQGYDVRLDLYGTKEEEQLRKYISEKGLVHAVTAHGWIGTEKKVRVLYESTMLVLPSHTEGVPNVILEAMATHTPIVATHVGGLKEVLDDGRNALIVRVNDPRDLSEKVKRLLENTELRMQLANRAWQNVVEKYDIQVVKNDLNHLLS